MSAFATGVSVSGQPCSEPGCGGRLVRHSLGCGISTYRCLDCIRRASAARAAADPARSPARSTFSKLLHEFATWQESDA